MGLVKKLLRRAVVFLVLLVLIGTVLTGCAPRTRTAERTASSGTETTEAATESAVQTRPEPLTTVPESTQLETSQPETTQPETTLPLPTETETEPAPPETLEVRFLNVGQGDAAVLRCGDSVMLIDGGLSNQSDKLYTVMRNEGIERLDLIVATHPHEDHVGGIAGALNAVKSAGLLWTPVAEYDSREYEAMLRYAKAAGAKVTVPNVGDTFALGSAVVEVLAPLSVKEDMNNSSLVVRVEFGETSFLFTGDAGTAEELELLGGKNVLRSTVLKVGHHGADTSTSGAFLATVMPKYAVISCGERNKHGHPSDGLLNRLKERNITLYRTDMQGDISCISDGKQVSFSPEKRASNTYLTYYDLYGAIASEAETTVPASEEVRATAAPETEPKKKETEPEITEPVRAQGEDYILNTSTKKFHYPNCRSVKQMKEKNKEYFHGTREEVIQRGYEPCGNCHP
ncbi:MAG: MBL fold metallo-hydrolase [Lachnospiraceae bacterium]|nr:MBL fold metallo-hydrolase [Lachnospiraceae bacterium]